MTVDPYVGSAGGQPRLILPFPNINRPPTAAEWNRTMRTLYTWANSLLLPVSGSGLVLTANGGFELDSDFTTGTFDWVADYQEGFTYLQSDRQTFEFPDDSVSIVVLSVAIRGKSGLDPVGYWTAEPPCNQATMQLYVPGPLLVADSDGQFNPVEASRTGFHIAGMLGYSNSSETVIGVPNASFDSTNTLASDGWVNILTFEPAP
jgi:hypothetical protein